MNPIKWMAIRRNNEFDVLAVATGVTLMPHSYIAAIASVVAITAIGNFAESRCDVPRHPSEDISPKALAILFALAILTGAALFTL